MDESNLAANEEERMVLRDLYEAVSALRDLDNTISDSRLFKVAQKNLKSALRGVEFRCTCAKRSWGGPCEVCQGSDRELYGLRSFYRTIRKAKERDMTKMELQTCVDGMRKNLTS